ncbi:sulfotransferase family protein [Pseudomonas sp. NY15435]|uniref:sulfotransferase family protein n=1 Tax=Pseudomonas sp. NY15435 TaxID=3400358 RepID=UPI003A89BB60
MPIIVGVPRSGTTLLRFILDAHPQLAIPPETGFLMNGPLLHEAATPAELARRLTQLPESAPAWADFALDAEHFVETAARLPKSSGLPQVLRLFYQLYAARLGKPRFGDKTPAYLQHMRTIAGQLPEARFIHILRDGRDVALSWSQTWFAPEREPERLVQRWAGMIAEARQQAHGLPYLELRYDQLLKDPQTQVRRICEFIELDFHPAMLNYHLGTAKRLEEHQARFQNDGQLLVSKEQRLRQQWRTTLPPDVGRINVWRAQLSLAQQAACKSAGGELLAEFD